MTEAYQVTAAEPVPYVAPDSMELAEFLILSGNLAEVDNLAGHPEVQQAQADDIAEKIFRHGIAARILADVYEIERINQIYGHLEIANTADKEAVFAVAIQPEASYA